MISFPQLKQPEGSLYCGGYCVVACLQAFDLLPLTSPILLNRFDRSSKRFVGTEVAVTDKKDLDAMAIDIYAITGILSEDGAPPYVENSGSNSLAATIYVLNKFGLKTEVVISNELALSSLKAFVPAEFELFEQLGAPVVVLNGEPATFPNSALISVIALPKLLHYVVNNDRGEWFDPQIGVYCESWDPITEWDTDCRKRENANWLGISIRVS